MYLKLKVSAIAIFWGMIEPGQTTSSGDLRWYVIKNWDFLQFDDSATWWSNLFIKTFRKLKNKLNRHQNQVICTSGSKVIKEIHLIWYFRLHFKRNHKIRAGLDSSTILDVLISSTVYDKYCQHFLAMLKYINSFQHKIGIILSMLSYTNGLCKVSKTDVKSC